MKKVLVLFVTSFSFAFAGVYSDTSKEGQESYYNEVDTTINQNTDNAIKKIESMKSGVVTAILNNDKQKKRYLENEQNLTKEELLDIQEVSFELDKFKQLNGIK